MTEAVIAGFIGFVLGAIVMAIGYKAGVERGRMLRDDDELDQALDPGDTIGQLPSSEATQELDLEDWPTQDIDAVGESSGRHYAPVLVPADWRHPSALRTERFTAVTT